MAAESSERATSSSTPRWTYEVFLSFRSEGTRRGFTDLLYSAMKQRGIVVFGDEEKVERGENNSEELLEAIRESKCAVIVISKDYEFSNWCLIELTEIMKCKTEKGLAVFPVFYDVDPYDVRHQEGSFARAFLMHIVDKEQKKMWRDALKEVGNHAGWDVRGRNESEVVEEICLKIIYELRCPIVRRDLFGIESQTNKLMILLRNEGDVRFVGIWGMLGIGKTTLAKVVFRRVRSQFECGCFIASIRKARLDDLQRLVISEILGERLEKYNTCDTQKSMEHGLRNRKVFIVLDDIDKEDQLKAWKHEWFGKGSRILITSRNRQLLMNHADETYEVEKLTDHDALQLFSYQAFNKAYPEKNYVEISKEIVSYAQNHPLTLEIVGSFLYGESEDKWRRDHLYEALAPTLLEKFEMSFRESEWHQRELFLDIVCFFNGTSLVDAIQKLHSLGHYSKNAINVLMDKSLINIVNGKFYVHTLFASMGQEIVLRQSEKPGQRSRLWRHDDIFHVLETNTGTDAVEGIVLKLPLSCQKKLSLEAFSKMNNLRMLVIRPETFDEYGVPNREICEDLKTVEWLEKDPSKLILSKELRVLEWWGYPFGSWPAGLQQRLTHRRQYIRLNVHTKENL